jgi:phosphoglycolate phosphatase
VSPGNPLRETTICLFDLDGTLLDSREPILTAMNRALATLGLEPVTGEQLWPHIGPPLRVLLEALLIERGDDPVQVEPLVQVYRAEYRSLSIELARTYPGIPDLLDALAGGARLGVVTSKPQIFALPILETLGLAARMEVIEGADPTDSEPKPVTLARALDRLGMDSGFERVAMIGDRRHDIEAGRGFGLRTVGVTWGFGSREELLEAGADAIVDHPSQITPLVIPLGYGDKEG